jgi:xylan 1,4-beta-xylosidase
MGRETGIEEVVWRDDWLYLEGGGLVAREKVPAPVATTLAPDRVIQHEFGGPLPADFQWLRKPDTARIFREDADALVLIGRESIGRWFEQSLVARRQEHFTYTASTTVAFEPTTYQQAAGLTTYYNRHKFHAVLVISEAGIGRPLTLISCAGDWPESDFSFPTDPVALSADPVKFWI